MNADLKGSIKHFVVYGVGSVSQSGLQFLLLPLLTKSLGIAQFGAYSLILLISSAAGTIFFLGMTTAMPRSYFDYETSRDKRALFTLALIILLIGAAIQMALGFFCGSKISILLFGDETQSYAITIALFSSAFSFINQYLFTYLRLEKKSIAFTIFNLASLLISILFILFLLDKSINKIEATFEAILYSQIIISFAFLLIYNNKLFSLEIHNDEIKKLISIGWVTVVGSVSVILLEYMDKFIIHKYMGLDDVGIYYAAFKLGSLIQIIFILPFVQIWNPIMLEHRQKKNIKSIFNKAFSYYYITGVLIIIGFSLFIGDIYPLIIKSPLNLITIPVIIITMLGYFFNGITNIVSAGFFYERTFKKMMIVYYGLSFLKIGLNLHLIPEYGILGAAYISLIINIMIPCGIAICSRSLFSFHIDWKLVMRASLIASPALAAGILLSSNIDLIFSWWIRALWVIASCVLIYMYCLPSSDKKIFKKYIKYSNKKNE
jgi:O-antigen/teichoic acid export membrane protein